MEGLRKTGKEMEELIFSWICHMTKDGELWPFFISRVTCLRAWEQVEVQSWCLQRGTGGISLHNMARERSLEMEEEEEEMAGFQVKCVIHIRGCVPLSYWNPLYLEIVNIYFWPLVVLTNLVFNKVFFFSGNTPGLLLRIFLSYPIAFSPFSPSKFSSGHEEFLPWISNVPMLKMFLFVRSTWGCVDTQDSHWLWGWSWHISEGGGYVMSRSCLV